MHNKRVLVWTLYRLCVLLHWPCRGSPVNAFFAVIFVNTDARVAPVAFVGCASILFTSCDDSMSGLANKFGFVGAWAFYFVDARFLDGVMFGRVSWGSFCRLSLSFPLSSLSLASSPFSSYPLNISLSLLLSFMP